VDAQEEGGWTVVVVRAQEAFKPNRDNCYSFHAMMTIRAVVLSLHLFCSIHSDSQPVLYSLLMILGSVANFTLAFFQLRYNHCTSFASMFPYWHGCEPGSGQVRGSAHSPHWLKLNIHSSFYHSQTEMTILALAVHHPLFNPT